MAIFTKPDLELSAAEAKSLARLAMSSDIDVLITVMKRWQILDVHELLRTPRDGQDLDLLIAQGGVKWLNKMQQYIESVGADQPRSKKA